ncbi:MAG: hypothetical protein Q7K40_05200 [bacterium]|nr:hypothetical protein [bacterium]
MKKIISPILYTLSAILVFFLVVESMRMIETMGRSHTLWREGDVDFIFLLTFWGIVVCGGASYFLLRFEGTKNPTMVDHVRHSFMLYVMSPFFIFIYINAAMYERSDLAAVLGTVIIAVFFVVIVINALTLLIIAKKHKSHK